MQLENEYENLKNMARYIDSGTKTISDCVKTKDYSALSSGEDDKLISDIKDGIDIFKKEVNDIMKQLSGLNGISSLMSQAANEIFENSTSLPPVKLTLNCMLVIFFWLNMSSIQTSPGRNVLFSCRDISESRPYANILSPEGGS